MEGRGVLLEWDNLGWEWEGGLYFKSGGCPAFSPASQHCRQKTLGLGQRSIDSSLAPLSSYPLTPSSVAPEAHSESSANLPASCLVSSGPRPSPLPHHCVMLRGPHPGDWQCVHPHPCHCTGPRSGPVVRAQGWALGAGITAHTSAQEAVFCGERLGERRLEAATPSPALR